MNSKKKLTWLILFSVAMVVAVSYYAERAWATPPAGYKSTTLYKGTFADFDVFNQFPPPHSGELWTSMQKTTAPSDLYIQQNVWQPGGTTGWHSHPGHSLIMVTEGTVTEYEGNDPACTPHVYTKGMTLVDPGGDHEHVIRNETGDEAQTVAVQIVPAGAPRRLDKQDPGNCHF